MHPHTIMSGGLLVREAGESVLQLTIKNVFFRSLGLFRAYIIQTVRLLSTTFCRWFHSMHTLYLLHNDAWTEKHREAAAFSRHFKNISMLQ